MMPGMDGWEVAAHLDRDPRTRGVPVVVVSGKPLADLEGAPGRAMAAAVLSKPFDFVTFVDVVAEVMRPVLPQQRPAADDTLRDRLHR
jgi:CheY-like chemotaxis protein